MKILRSIGALVAGFLTCFVLAILTDVVLVMAGVLPDPKHPELYSDGLYVIIFAYTTLYSGVGGWVTARVAATKPLQHALVLGVLGMSASAFGAWANWDKATGHEWYPIALIIMAIPACYAGGWLHARRKHA